MAKLFKSIESFSGEYRFLSNFWPCEINYFGLIYPSVENAYQAQKPFNCHLTQRDFLNITAGKSKRLAATLQPHEINPEWHEIKLTIMTDLVARKFLFNEELRQKLIDTGDAILVEGNTWGDTYWGMCNGIGENNLGKILMKVRDCINEER